MQRDDINIISRSTGRSVKEMRRVFEPECTSRNLESFDDVKMRRERSSCGVSRQRARSFSGTCPESAISHVQRKDDELIRNMSKLPGFLQNVNEDYVQDKALNCGVIDWKKLEKWKYNERTLAKNIPKSSFSTHGMPRTDPAMVRTASLQSTRQSMPSDSHFKSVQRQCSPRSSRPSSLSKGRSGTCDGNGIHSKQSKPRVKESFNQNNRSVESGYKGVKCSLSEACAKESSQTGLNNKNTQGGMEDIPYKEEVSPSLQSKLKFSPSEHEKLNACPEKSELMFHDGFGFTYLSCSVDKDFPLNVAECSQSNGSRSSFDGYSDEEIGNRFSLFCSQEVNSIKLPSVTADSCPRSPDSPAQEKYPLDLHNGCSSDLQNSFTSIMSESRCSTMPGKAVKPSTSQFEFPGKNTGKGRASSPLQGFSFGLGKMSRSSKFMETPVVPESASSDSCSSLESSLTKPEVPSTISDRIQRDNANANGKGRSSPLRRLLDPLLKHKATQSSEIIRPQYGSLPPKPKTHPKGPSKNMQCLGLKVQAFLRVTLKNELPLFKLVTQTSNSMLVAAAKKLWIPGKRDPSVIYSFYSVQGIKKRNMNWLTKGANSKTCSLAYNMIGQLKISKPCHPKVSCSGSSECEKWECELYAADPQQESKQNAIVLKKEIAAIITNFSNENCNDGEDKDFCGTSVILPGGEHGKPVTGSPSSLASRWRGSCDCGGWDIGCKLRVLKQVSKNLQEPFSNSTTDSLKLCVEGQEHKMDPIFSIEPLNTGLYSIQFDDSVPLLEAFATCVAHLTPLKFPGTMAAKEQTSAYSPMGTDDVKVQEPFRVQDLPVKYTSCPPLSPAARI